MATDFPLFVFFFHPSLLVLLARACWLIIFCRFKKKMIKRYWWDLFRHLVKESLLE